MITSAYCIDVLGDPTTMNNLNIYGVSGICATVVDELGARVKAALDAGVRRWNIGMYGLLSLCVGVYELIFY